MTTRKPHKPHWYEIHVCECPMCGRDNGWRVRMYTPKPKNPEKRYIQESITVGYCGCMDREMFY